MAAKAFRLTYVSVAASGVIFPSRFFEPVTASKRALLCLWQQSEHKLCRLTVLPR